MNKKKLEQTAERIADAYDSVYIDDDWYVHRDAVGEVDRIVYEIKEDLKVSLRIISREVKKRGLTPLQIE